MKTISAALLGAPLDPFSNQTRQHIALVAFLAWIGLGADGLSSSCYGPEEAFLALGEHTHLALYMAAATALTVFVIAVGYNQVIELFPSGGGGYKVRAPRRGIAGRWKPAVADLRRRLRRFRPGGGRIFYCASIMVFRKTASYWSPLASRSTRCSLFSRASRL
jgi:hypothetical protein